MIEVLYHWSPKRHRESIMQNGLQVYKKVTVTSKGHRFAHTCCGTTPSAAWGLSGGMRHTLQLDEDVWDLWMIRPAQTDHLHICPFWGPHIEEVRICNSVPADRIWWVGERTDIMLPVEDKDEHGTERPKRKRPKNAGRLDRFQPGAFDRDDGLC